ncbi:MAG: hypothetical protein ACJ8BW_02045 [Ktedonobacteraceae bacterium]|jgi:hypothetical protein
MLIITVGATEVYDEKDGTFTAQGGTEFQLEHSLVSLSKWESEFEKPFLGKGDKTPEETLAYIGHMVLSPNPPGDFLQRLSKENLETVNAYINRKMTATWFSDQPSSPRTREVITSELIYYWMTGFNIPFSCETWHLNRLFTLIRVCNAKQEKPQKMSRGEISRRNRELNAQRKAQLGTTG